MGRNLQNKTIFITGASSGIGRHTALCCAKAGMDVSMIARRQEKLEEVAEQIRQAGRRALVMACDVNDQQRLADALSQTFDTFGRLDVLYANAGYGIFGQVDALSEQAHRDIFETNYFATLSTLRIGLPYLRQTADGLKHILICSSAASEIGLPMFGAYSATKAAQDSIAGAMRAELADEGIWVTSIHPVGTRTEFFNTAGELSKADSLQHNAPEMFTQSAEHVAKCIVKSLRKPRPEVWPSVLARLGLAGATLLPGMTNHYMRKHVQQLKKAHGRGGEDPAQTSQAPADKTARQAESAK